MNYEPEIVLTPIGKLKELIESDRRTIQEFMKETNKILNEFFSGENIAKAWVDPIQLFSHYPLINISLQIKNPSPPLKMEDFYQIVRKLEEQYKVEALVEIPPKEKFPWFYEQDIEWPEFVIKAIIKNREITKEIDRLMTDAVRNAMRRYFCRDYKHFPNEAGIDVHEVGGKVLLFIPDRQEYDGVVEKLLKTGEFVIVSQIEIKESQQ